MSSGLDERFATMLEIARGAGSIAHGYFARRGELAIEEKGVQDLVSVADREAEAFIRERIARRFPDDGFFGEEGGEKAARAMWVVDPIDGTTNFLRGLPHYGVSIAFVRDGITEMGAVFAPELGELYAARRGQGATLNGQPLRVTTTRRFAAALIGLGYSKKTPPDAYLETIRALFARDALYRLLGSAALMICQVAAGRVDAFFEAKLSAWDALAGLLIVREAGGRTVPSAEDEHGWRTGPVLASNVALAPELCALLAKTQPGFAWPGAASTASGGTK
ncbi:MAG: inositol monophosphatase [Myxococcaceae bacterium]|nr:inositol monophosphatase [Myxococcaceae bacterium]